MRADLATELLKRMGNRVPSKLIDFGRALETYLAGSADFEWRYFLDKPWKWSEEYVAWANADYPQEGDEGWEDFDRAMEVIVNA
jgi:hypothetical protein